MGYAVVGSFVSLFWSCCFLAVTLWIAALVLVQSLLNYRVHHCNSPPLGSEAELCDTLQETFGTVQSAMMTLFQGTTGGTDWKDIYDVVGKGGSTPKVIFLSFIIFFNFALFNIITSTFVDKALRLARSDEDLVIAERSEEEKKVENQLRELIRRLDEDESGYITIDELQKATEDERILHKFDMLGITVRDVQTFFHALKLHAHEDHLTVDLFVEGCMKMKGPPSSLEVQAIGFKVQEILTKVRGPPPKALHSKATVSPKTSTLSPPAPACEGTEPRNRTCTR